MEKERPVSKFEFTPSFADKPIVVIEAHDNGDSIGICVPMDGAELYYFNKTEARMIAYALLSMLEE